MSTCNVIQLCIIFWLTVAYVACSFALSGCTAIPVCTVDDKLKNNC